jgi:hypothetical protein
MKSFPESPHYETEGSASASEAKQAPNPAPQAESLLAAEKQTLEKMANGASRSEVLNDLCEIPAGFGFPCRLSYFSAKRLDAAAPDDGRSTKN